MFPGIHPITKRGTDCQGNHEIHGPEEYGSGVSERRSRRPATLAVTDPPKATITGSRKASLSDGGWVHPCSLPAVVELAKASPLSQPGKSVVPFIGVF